MTVLVIVIVIIIVITAVVICIYRTKRLKETRDIVKDGRLTKEIIDFLKEYDRLIRLKNLKIYNYYICVHLHFAKNVDYNQKDWRERELEYKSFDLSQRLSEYEMQALAEAIRDAFGKEYIRLDYNRDPNNNQLRRIDIFPKKELADKYIFTGGSNW